ncbi:ATP-dependent RNA helicase HrpA [Microbacterium trichothecenolyticum]|uniref:ATP-dependent helicase HrpA n=1 Tax=Microbacterium trichothecenolyticum TaxID=69370 RepID=A0ABU0TPJ7_MICTR|nr:ATP-dependent RNA helicase HrpA [Microbacterium trichothecenolyticum]MDQ1121603.1 ATP-dependent helicase HrpA [Microbacterium trichothecenolyticum]
MSVEPVIVYPPELPVSAARDEIARAIRDNQVVIVAGATGSGKTTQLPKICLELGRTSIAHTQPRRIAARTIAERIAEEMQVPLGSTVGYKVRFTDKVSADTRVALVTDGILLNEIHRDRLLRRYDTIIVDEAHERSLNIDFLLGYLRRILPKRPDLKVIVTSATIDPESFARHFAAPPAQPGGEPVPAPVIEVSGRTYPVEIRYRPLDGADRAPEDSDDETLDAGIPAPQPKKVRSPARPAAKTGRDGDDADEVGAVVAALRELDREPAGDVLVFFPGEAEIRDAADAIRGAYQKDAAPTEVLPLYGRLSAAEQHRVFERSTVAGVRRRVILATNVAETSLTVPGIRYVVDTGTARISRYSNRSKIQRLPIEAVSQASAQQRSGRAGRTSPGVAIRLYSEDDFTRRPEYTEPEILRTSLASVILQMLSLGFGDIQAFPFLTPPDSRGVKAAFDLLVELGAVKLPAPGARPRDDRPDRDPSRGRGGRDGRDDDRGPRLTEIGREIARLPIDPRFARMLIEARRNDVQAEVLAIVSGMSIQDVRERPEDRREEADRFHARFTDPTSDFLSLLNLWDYLQEKQAELGSSAFRRLCRSEHLNYVRVREWVDVHRQLRSLGAEGGGRDGGGGRDHRGRAQTRDAAAPSTGQPEGHAQGDAIHRAILSGLLSHIGILDPRTIAQAKDRKAPGDARPTKGEYIGARGARFAIFPGSGLKKKRPSAVMAAELVETSRLFARTVAAVDPAWAEELAPDLVKRSLSEPHWSKDAGSAAAYEKVTLFGVELVGRRRVQLARFDRPLAREMFVRHALVEGEWDPSVLDKRLTAFLRRNVEQRRLLEKIEERERRRDILIGDEAVFAFYNARIRADVTDVRSFEAWWKDAIHRTPHLLDLRESDLTGDRAQGDDRAFPARWRQGDQTLNLAYRFEPGAPDDGVTVVVPLPLLAQLRPDGFDWQVPGMRDELVTALLRALPKTIRRNVVPAADWAEKFSAELAEKGPEHANGLPRTTLVDALAALVQRVANQRVSAADFELERVPAHLLPSFRAVDARGRAVGSDRDLGALQRRLADRARSSVEATVARPAARTAAQVAEASPAFASRSKLTTWDLDELTEVVDTPVAGGVVRGYPALVDEGDSVALRVEATPEEATRLTRAGIRRLMLLAVPSPATYVLDHLTANEKLALAASPYQNAKALIEDARVALADDVLLREAPTGIVRTRAEFERVRDAFSAASVERTFQTVSLAAKILLAQREVERAMKDAASITLLGALNDVRGQVKGLLFPGFLSRTGLQRLQHYPRYLAGALERVKTLSDNPGRDRQRMTEYERAAAGFVDAGGAVPLPAEAAANLVQTRWLLEELRVSLFAQRLGTAEPVSPQRIAKALKG